MAVAAGEAASLDDVAENLVADAVQKLQKLRPRLLLSKHLEFTFDPYGEPP